LAALSAAVWPKCSQRSQMAWPHWEASERQALADTIAGDLFLISPQDRDQQYHLSL
jgi:hypothetical protein